MTGKRRFRYEDRNKPHTRCGCPDCRRLYHELNVEYKKKRLDEWL